MESGSEPQQRGHELLRDRAGGRQLQLPEVSTAAAVAPRRLHVLGLQLEWRPRDEVRRQFRLRQVQHPEVHQRESGVPLSQRRGLRLPVRGGLRLRQPEHEHEQQPVRHLRAGRLGRDAPAAAEPRRALGLRVEHVQQQLHDAGARGGRAGQPIPGELFHGWHAAAGVQGSDPAAPRLQLRARRRRADDGVRRLRHLLRPVAGEQQPRREIPAAVPADQHRVLGGRPAA